MEEIFKTLSLKNGLSLEFIDHSLRYYGDYHRVRIEVRCRIPLEASCFAGAADAAAELERAVALLGPETFFTRTLEQMGVAGDRLEVTKKSLVASFLDATRPYLESPGFVARFVARQLQRKSNVTWPFPKPH